MSLNPAIEIGNFIMFNADELDQIKTKSPQIHTAIVGVIAQLSKKYGIIKQQAKTQLTPREQEFIEMFMKAYDEILVNANVTAQTIVTNPKTLQPLFAQKMMSKIFEKAKQDGVRSLMFELSHDALQQISQHDPLLVNYLALVGFAGQTLKDDFIALGKTEPSRFLQSEYFKDLRSTYVQSKPQGAQKGSKTQDELLGLTLRYPNLQQATIKKVLRQNPKTNSYEVEFIKGPNTGKKGKINIDRRLKDKLLAGQKVSGYFLIEKQQQFTPSSGTSYAPNTGNRPSPTQSASELKPGTELMGNDGNMYFVKETKNGVKVWKKSTKQKEEDYSTWSQDKLKTKRDEIIQALSEFDNAEPEYEELRTELETIELYIKD